ncbi:hypothetical protein AVEN_49637-1 [Araneus ventricosus]|uniref:Uncharacterized protein n=1 Tax=Araneus ventricosus TaxID=182803 RepID=A0A4Y2H7I2_ARAVE|nr:hypothetical protein AVEN_49637-1 [Araneus ventricosus]
MTRTTSLSKLPHHTNGLPSEKTNRDLSQAVDFDNNHWKQLASCELLDVRVHEILVLGFGLCSLCPGLSVPTSCWVLSLPPSCWPDREKWPFEQTTDQRFHILILSFLSVLLGSCTLLGRPGEVAF